MEIYNPPDRVNLVRCVDGQIIYPKIIDIGAWDMNTDLNKVVAHGLGAKWKNIISISIHIVNDSDNLHFISPTKYHEDYNLEIGVKSVNATNIYLVIRSGASGYFYHTASFSSTSSSRGFLTVWFVE